LTVGKGDIFIITPGMEHSLSAIPEQDFELVVLDFFPAFVGDQINHYTEALYRRILAQDDGQSASMLLQPWLHIDKSKQPLVEQLLQDIQDEFEHQEEGYAFSIQLNLIKLLILIDREHRRSERKPGREPVLVDRHPIQEVVRFVTENYSQDIPLEQGADIAGMAPAYFSHLFKKVTGRTFIEFQHEVRIDRAMELIRRGDHSITEIAYQVGFRHLSHFIRTFKKRTGLTPSEYKKSFAVIS
jgi:AraC-like DNA-binding protein